MKLPEVVGRYKIRNAKILQMYATDSNTMEEIALRFKITPTRVGQIIYQNKALLKIDKEYEKLKRLAVLKRLLKKMPQEPSKKDTVLAVVDAMRIESEGNRVEHTGQIDTGTKVIIIHPPKETSGERRDSLVSREDRSLHTTLPI